MVISSQKQQITKMIMTTTIAVIAFSVLAMGSLGGSAYGQPSPPACPSGYILDRGECRGGFNKCPEGYNVDFQTGQCVGKPGKPANVGN
jgi:hypothetical protein